MITYYTKEGKFEAIGYFEISYKNLHREDGPAVIWDNGDKEWYKEGKLHRVKGPAIKRKNYSKEWYVNGKRHRLDGPAYIMNNGYTIWYVNGEKLSAKEVKTWIIQNNINLKTKEHQTLFMLRFG